MYVNDVVAAKLTRRGAFMINEQNRELMYRFPQQKLKCDYRCGDLYEQYLWVLMKHFGREFDLGKEAPFTDLYPTDGRKTHDHQPEPKPLESV